MKKWMVFLLIGAMLLGSAGCGQEQMTSDDLMETVTKSTEPELPADPAALEPAVQDFGVRLLQHTASDGENTLISPLSVLYALGMTANGAEGETLTQMEQVLGISVEKLNPCLRDYSKCSGDALKLANGIWFRDDPRLHIAEGFLQSNQNFYDGAIRQAPFDESTLKEINNWTEEKTNGMVKDILDKIPKDAVLYLINALAFEGKWEVPYEEPRNDTFTNFDGTKTEVSMMFSQEHTYLKGEHATGFLKYYEGGRYAFAAILPEEGMDIQTYVQSLTGEKLGKLLTSASSRKVNTAMPKFETDYRAALEKVLKEMGMPDAFDGDLADFDAMGTYEDGKLCIGRVLHKTHITVDTEGTKAGAATAVEIKTETTAIEPEDIKTVILNRPFVYMILDCENNVPLFMGTMEKL